MITSSTETNLKGDKARLRVVESINAGVPLPPTVQEPVGGILQHDLVSLRDVHRLVRYLLSERRDVLGFDGGLDELGELLDGLLEIPKR